MPCHVLVASCHGHCSNNYILQIHRSVLVPWRWILSLRHPLPGQGRARELSERDRELLTKRLRVYKYYRLGTRVRLDLFVSWKGLHGSSGVVSQNW